MSAGSETYDADGQARRRAALVGEFTARRVDWFDDEGDWAGDPRWEAVFWTRWMYVTPFMMSADPVAVRRANAMLEKGRGWELDLLHELAARKGMLTPEAVAAMEKVLADVVVRKHQDPYREFKGDNDNHPFMSAAALALWGGYTHDAGMIDLAARRLESFVRMLVRRGLGSEYTAPGYLPMQLHPVALIAEFGPTPELRTLARDIETRLWIDLLGHFHFPSRALAGPYTRAHNGDLFYTSFAHMNAALVLGEDAAGDWQRTWEAVDQEFYIRRAVNKACVPYHCPTWLAEWALSRTYPCEMLATADGCPSYTAADPEKTVHEHRPLGRLGEDVDAYEHPAWHTRVATYMTKDYSIGTSTRMFSSAEQFNIFVVTAATRPSQESVLHTARFYSRYVVNEDLPFETQLTPGDQVIFREMTTRQPCFHEMGRAVALQHERTAMVLYHPRLHVARGATSLKAMIFIPNRDYGRGGPHGDEIYMGSRRVDDHRGESAGPATVFVRCADTYAAFIPLITCPFSLERAVAVRVRPEGPKALGISFYNYEGDPLDLDRRRCALVGNGFVCEMGSRHEDGDFGTFMKRFEAVEVHDRHHGDFNTRNAFRRQTLYRRPGLELETEYSPLSEGIRFQTVNGRAPREPKLRATGLPLEGVPFA